MGKLSNFSNTRCRLQRLKDRKFLAGWVSEFDGADAKIRLSAGAECEPGDQFLVEIFGPDCVATFQAGLSMAFDKLIKLTVFPGVKFRHTTEMPRFCVTSITGFVSLGGQQYDCHVTDISREGMGILLRKQLPRKESIDISLSTPVGAIAASAEVRYCRLDQAGNGHYRVGLKLKDLGRLEKARWSRLIEEELTA